ncbi:eukaryotic translation initiation factor 3 subunit L [Anabrus simplex]|uniref:eukaryotic translation initiation factor 3 subunit L n=1 Tax=Anabrus simplex TaxID=316456 RepID=UPI0035A2AB29
MNGNDDFTEQSGYESYGYGEYDTEAGETHSEFEYDRQLCDIPEVVKKFLLYFRDSIDEGALYEIQNLYENTFPKLTEQFFEKRPWPEDDDIAHIVDYDYVFLILYKELYYRHIYGHISGGPTLQQRFGSFDNYCKFFNYILSTSEPVSLDLPDLWLWELIDEFVYQFQSYAQYRARLMKRTAEELDIIAANNDVWNVLCVLNVLYCLIDKSNIKRQLEVHASGGDSDSVAGDFGRHPLYKKLGYFSLVGLLQVHSLLGDYYQAIKVLENIELQSKAQLSYVPSCQITISYYVAFAYMMMRRYSDAIRTLSSVLLYIQRTKQLFSSRSYQNEQINKQMDQMYHLLALCLVLHPQCIDDALQQVLRESYHDKMYKMQCGDLAEFEACFLYACPKFLASSPPSCDDLLDDYVKEPILYQTEVFMDEVRQQRMLPTIRSFLKLYTTLPLPKLATFMYHSQLQAGDGIKKWNPIKALKELVIDLLCFKHKMKNVVWTKGTSGLGGTFQSGSELDFYIDHNMIHIADTKVAHRYGDFFIRKIHKFEELNHKLQLIKI